MHDEFPTRPEHWAKHLEGSYADRDQLRTLDGLGHNWLYIDHGWREMQWATHCNTEVVRWTVRSASTVETVDSSLLVRNGWWRQTGNSSSSSARSRTRRTTSRAVAGWLVEVNAVNATSATSASEINSPVSGSTTAPG
jgi:hypothetical protein